MRRADREMNKDFAYKVVDKCEYAVLSMIDGDKLPYSVPITIVRENDSVYFHCAMMGKKVECLKINPNVSVVCVGDTKVVEGKFTTEYESAILYGLAEFLSNREEKIHALKILCERHTPNNMINFDAAIQRSLSITNIVRINITQVYGKRKKYNKDGIELKFQKEE